MKKKFGPLLVFGLAVIGLGACGGSQCDGLPQDEGIACAENYQEP